MALTTSPDGTTLYVAATNTPVADADGVVRAQIRQTLWRLDTGTGVRFAVRTWFPEDGARLPEQRSEPLALLATDDTVDLLVSYQRAASVAGLELPAATALASNGLPRTAVILRLSPRDGSPLRVFVPPPSLGRDLAVLLLADHPVFARSGGGARISGCTARWARRHPRIKWSSPRSGPSRP